MIKIAINLALLLAVASAAKLQDAPYRDDDSDIDNRLFYYDPIAKTQKHINMPDIVVYPRTTGELEREASEVSMVDAPAPKPSSIEIGSTMDSAPANNAEQVKSIAFNSREVRLVGPDRREVEMKDDVATKMAIALDNLQKEASQVWGQVNSKLDKGWSEFKAMVDEVIAKKPSSSPSARYSRETPSSSLVVPSDMDGYSLADAPSDPSTSEKIRKMFIEAGFTEENRKKASEALSKAGSSVAEAVTKDIPNAFNKVMQNENLKSAGDKVSETVTKDIPDAFNKLIPPETMKSAGDKISEMVNKDIPDAFNKLPDTLKNASDKVSETFKNIFG